MGLPLEGGEGKGKTGQGWIRVAVGAWLYSSVQFNHSVVSDSL